MNGKKIAAIVVVLAIVGCVIGYFAYGPSWEKEQKQRIEQFLADLPGNVKAESIEVSYMNKSVTLTNVSANFSDVWEIEYSLRIDKLVASGLNMSADKEKGVAKLADSLEADNITFVSAMPEYGFEQKGTLKELVAKDIRMDLGSLVRDLQAGVDRKMLFKHFMTLRMGSLTYVDYVISNDMGLAAFVMSVASVEAKDVGLLQSGKTSMNGFRVIMEGAEVFRLQSISLDGMRIPDIISPMFNYGDDDFRMMMEYPMTVQMLIVKEGMEIRNLVMEDFFLQVPGSEPVSLASVKADFRLSGEDMILTYDIKDLNIPAEILRGTDRDLGYFFQAYNNPLVFSGTTDNRIYREGNAFRLVSKAEFADPGLGAAKGSLEMEWPASGNLISSLQMADEPRLRSFDVQLDDSGFLKYFFEARFRENQYYQEMYGYYEDDEDYRMASADDLRRALVREMREDIPYEATMKAKEIMNAFTDFVENGGSFYLSMAVKNGSIDVSDLADFDELPEDLLDIRVERTAN